MPSLNFTVFLDKVADGTKPHTIRALRKHPIKSGDDLSFFTGMRTKSCRRLRANTPCTAAVCITIDGVGRVFLDDGSRFYRPGKLTRSAIEQLARRDGFATVADFFAFFAKSTDNYRREGFVGQLIEWVP